VKQVPISENKIKNDILGYQHNKEFNEAVNIAKVVLIM
jgi:hypothetical protein